jgi:hypothetical protein
MSGRFAACAAKLAGTAALLLGWRPAEFWQATPAELAAILEAVGLEAMGGGEADACAADELARLMEMFPDG